MCSIFAILDINGDLQAMRQLALQQSRLLRHRGPDWSGIHTCDAAILAHERLAIVDINTGAQPLVSPDGKQSLAVNGEIYNHRSLRETLVQPFEFATESDCEVILPLYLEKGSNFLNDLHGMFAGNFMVFIPVLDNIDKFFRLIADPQQLKVFRRYRTSL